MELENREILHLNNFEGPLDLLLHLIKSKKMSIHQIDILEVATQYIKIISDHMTTNLDVAGEYLVEACKFLKMKSAEILTRDSFEKIDPEFVEKEKQKLIKRLLEYEKYKSISDVLSIRAEQAIKFISKRSDNLEKAIEFDPDKMTYEVDIESTLMLDLFQEMIDKYEFLPQETNKAYVKINRISIEDRKEEILDLLEKNKNKELSINYLFKNKTIDKYIWLVTFMSVLDLAKYGILEIYQKEQSEEIFIKFLGENNGQ